MYLYLFHSPVPADFEIHGPYLEILSDRAVILLASIPISVFSGTRSMFVGTAFRPLSSRSLLRNAGSRVEKRFLD